MDSAENSEIPSKEVAANSGTKQTDADRAAHWMRLLDVGAERSTDINCVAVLSAN